jgi:uncharacterized protein (DUF2141 family)
MLRPAALPLLVSLLACVPPTVPLARVGPPPQLRPESASIQGSLAVEVTGIPSLQGQLFVELYDRRTYFHYAEVLNEQLVPVTATTMVVTLQHVPPGRYLVAVSHDANSNHLLDTGLFGVPTEAYGFSRGARGTFGPPAFEEGAFDFPGEAPVRVTLR